MCGVKGMIMKHGMCNKHPLYYRWKSMRNRCNNINSYDYDLYGGRNITVDQNWNDYKKFYEDMIGEWERCESEFPNETLTAERIDCNSCYKKDNLTFIPSRLQSKNRRNVYKFIVSLPDGNTITVSNLKEFCRDYKLKYDNIRYHFKNKEQFTHSGFTFMVLRGGL